MKQFAFHVKSAAYSEERKAAQLTVISEHAPDDTTEPSTLLINVPLELVKRLSDIAANPPKPEKKDSK